MKLTTRNRRALLKADKDPEGIVDASSGSVELRRILSQWAPGDPDFETAKKLLKLIASRFMVVVTESGNIDVDIFRGNAHEDPEIIRMLGELPVNPNDEPGLSLLTLVVEEMPVVPDPRKDSVIVPKVDPDRRAGRLFGGLYDGPDVTTRELPFFPESPTVKRVPLLDIVDLSGLPLRSKGRGAPVASRLFVNLLSSIQQHDRHRQTVRMAMTFDELRRGLYPNGWNRTLQWPQMKTALLTANNYAVHLGNTMWLPVALRQMPDNPRMDDMIVFDLALPPGSDTGPTVSLPDMQLLGVQSGPRWRAYIAAHTLMWKPGITRVPQGRTQYGWTLDVQKYPIITQDDRRRLAFGADDSKHRLKKEIDEAWQDLPGLKLIGKQESNQRTGEFGWRFIPDVVAVKLDN